MSRSRVTYPPLDLPKPIAENVWIVDSGPLKAFGMPLPVRMTVIRLADGGLLLHSPTRYDSGLRMALEEIGPIAHLVAPNSAHWVFVGDWQRHCPDAVTWSAPGLRRRLPVRRSAVRLDRDLMPDGRDWPREIEQIAVPGVGGFMEVALFHHPSRTLVLADLIQNFEAEKLPLPMQIGGRLAGIVGPVGRAPVYLRALVKMKGAAPREAARRMVALEPERVVFAHGAWFASDAARRLRQSLDWLLG
ncbi:DUF4336 domain-containing protein [Jiella sp. M17.18]|uniref:DUF4336 domain-containing protein n=1 Tax=Jiella sp. M17.18 TaxID=3234247 RepID=UPI0034DFF489